MLRKPIIRSALFATFAFVAASAALMMSQTVQADLDGGNALWPSAGQNLNNTRFQSAEHEIGVDNVRQFGREVAIHDNGRRRFGDAGRR